MKRDMDLIRALLLELESEEKVDLSGYEAYAITYHKYLIIDAELARGGVTYSDDIVFAAVLTQLTWEGHEFLDVARDESGWQQVTRSIGKTVGTVSLSLLQALLNQWAARKLGL